MDEVEKELEEKFLELQNSKTPAALKQKALSKLEVFYNKTREQIY